MTERKIDRDCEVAAQRLMRAMTVVPDVEDHLCELRARVGALGAGGGEGTSGGDVGDPTMRAVLELDAINYWQGRIDDAKGTLRKCIDMLEDVCTKALSHRTIPTEALDDTPQCIRTFVVDEANEVERRCDRPVEHYIREDGTTGWRSSGLCAACRQSDMRKARAQAA